MSVSLSPLFNGFQSFLANGLPNNGGFIYTYAAGTTTAKATYTTNLGTVTNSNPIILSADGRPPQEIWLTDGQAYKFVITDALSVGLPNSTFDNISGFVSSDIKGAMGSNSIGFIQTGSGALTTTVQAKARESVSVRDFLNATTGDCAAALQLAINSGAKKVKITYDYSISAPVNLAANQILDFDGGSLTTTAGITAPNGVLYGSGSKVKIKIIDPIIDASATVGISGIGITDCPGAIIVDGLLTKCFINLQSTNAALRMGYKVRGTVVNMANFLTTSIRVSAVKIASFTDVECFGGLEGFACYNACKNVTFDGCLSYGHTQDGFLLNSGQRISYSSCHSFSNGQSGFTTQRQATSSDVLDISYASCHAYDNVADGFDLRGHNSAVSWGTSIRITAVSCISTNNTGTGFYVVNAEGTALTGCIATTNAQQGIFVQNSNQTNVTGCQSNSNAGAVAAGSYKAGIHITDSIGCNVTSCISGNTAGASQQYGASFTGNAFNCALTGGAFQNNTGALWNIDSSATVQVSGTPAASSTSGFLNFINSQTKQTDESGNGVPTHVAPKTSVYRRIDGGARECYFSNGGGSWTQGII